MNTHRLAAVVAAIELLLALSLSSCGGSDRDSDPPPPPPPPPNPTSGLDSRPSNTSCVAWARSTSAISVTTPNAFPGLPFFSSPVGMYQAPNDSSRWFVVEQAGRVRAFPNQSAVTGAQLVDFVDIRSRVRSGGELGLLGMAFHPQFATNRHVFLFYSTGTDPLVLRVSRFTSDDNGATLNPNSEVVLLSAHKPRNSQNQIEENHNGGAIAFGPDGHLYIAIGDGGGGGDNHPPIGNGQRLTTLFGKILRIDVNSGSPYGIPSGATGNPYAGNTLCGVTGTGPQNCPEIFAFGFRNPWRITFDRQTGQLWAGDVGQGEREEVDLVARGGNYGWRCKEGSLDFQPAQCGGATDLIDPVAEYDHTLGFSITGGYVYRGSTFAPLVGRYIFGDFGTGRIWAWIPGGSTPRQPTQLADTDLSISSFGEGNDGELYAVSYGGSLHRLVFAGGAVTDNTPATLSASGCAVPGNATQPSSGLISYSINAPFWSDAASKERWMALPNGQTISVASDGDWQFPAGTVLMKNFRLNNMLVETRLLVHHPDGVWAGYTYEWNGAQTDATRVQGGATRSINGQSWIFPSEAQCDQCHTAAAGRALGLETAQLNRGHLYPQTGRTANQLTTHSAIDTVTPDYPADVQSLPGMPDPSDTTASLTNRARAYLHSNCANCHRPGGPTSSAMDLRYTTALAQTNACNIAPTSGDLGLPNARLIAPGNAAASVMPARMNRRDGNAMPPLGSNVIDAGGVALIEQWINSLSGC